jgi:O-antigen/teichoic acid export membrane protein
MDIPFIPVLLSAAGGGLLMQLASGDHTQEERLNLLNYSGRVLARVVFPVFFFFFFFRYEFITVVFSERYADAVPLFAISILVLPLRAYHFTTVLQHLNQVKTINLGAVLDLGLALSLSYPLFLLLGLPGVALAFLISTYVQVVFYLIKTAKYMHCSIAELIPWKSWLVMFIVFGIAGIALHDVLSRFLSAQYTLLLGFTATVMIIAAAMMPVVFSKKVYG